VCRRGDYGRARTVNAEECPIDSVDQAILLRMRAIGVPPAAAANTKEPAIL
jgi:hypothetical protein